MWPDGGDYKGDYKTGKKHGIGTFRWGDVRFFNHFKIPISVPSLNHNYPFSVEHNRFL